MPFDSLRAPTVLRFALLTLLAIATETAEAADRPNVVVFLSDDQGWGDLSSSGNGDLSTPHVDSLAAEGASFDRFYVCPVCSPTRAEFLTGRYHPRSGVYSTSAGGERMDLDEVTIADLFQRAGYATGAFGKWHNGMQYPYHPLGRGFEEYYGFCSGHWGNYFSPMLEHNGRIVDGEGFCIDDFTDRAMNFIRASVGAGKPFFAYLPYNTPHSPMQVPDEYWERFKDKPLEYHHGGKPDESLHKRCALAMCENLDWNVGRLLANLDELDVADDTIIVWFHDNGPNGWRWNGGMKGRKGSTDEGGCRSPLYVRWPNGIEAGTVVSSICTARDLLPTLCDLADVPLDTSISLDGQSLTPLLSDSEAEWPDRTLINHWKTKVSARTQRFRLDNTGKLFDMVADPGQTTNVASKFPDVTERLASAVTEYSEEFLPDYEKDERPFVIAHRDFAVTQLPARDAKATGQIKRSNRFPNCSYFGNWVSTDDVITFDATVESAGEFDVVLYYAAKSADAKCELTFADASLPFEIAQAHDVPELGAEHDRSPRAESYVKDFRAEPIGRITLPSGRGTLTLKANEIPGSEAFEFRMITLERVE